MRRLEKELKNPETIKALLEQSPVGRIATINRKGYPVIKPVNFFYGDGKIYIHSSLKGEKVADIRRGSPVCFEIDQAIAYVPASGPACKANYHYRSIIIKGRAVLVHAREKKLETLERLMEKYQPEGGYTEISEEILKKTAVIEVSVDELKGKESLK